MSQSFGSVSTGAGRSMSKSFVITNLALVPRTFTVTLADDAADGVLFSTNTGTVTLGPGQTTSATVTMNSAKGATDGDRQATLRVISSGVEVAHAMVFALIGEGDRAPGQHQLPPPKA